MEILTNILAAAGVLGVLVFIHEFGHYAAAKLCGVRVEVFSIGFGKRLFGFRRGDTDYRLSALPLGGYVKMSGENPFEASTGDPHEFMAHPRWQRFIIAIAGPFMNVVLSIAVMTGIYMVHFEHRWYQDQPAVIGWVVDKSPADKAGLQLGDKITRIDGVDNPDWSQVSTREAISAGQSLELTVQRDNKVFTTAVTPNAVGDDKHGDAGWDPFTPATVNTVEPGKAADKAGVQPGDQLVELNGSAIRSMPALQHMIQENGAKPAQLTLLRNGKEMHVTLTPYEDEIEGTKYFRIGVTHVTHIDKLSFPQAFSKSLSFNKDNSLLIFTILKRIAERKMSPRQMSGPIGIAQISGQAVREKGWIPTFFILALISLNLGVFNLLPIPILDGGLILLLLIEGLIRRDIRQEIKERIYQVAFVFIIALAVFVIYSDIAKTALGRHLGLP